jgi:hypothetical protein
LGDNVRSPAESGDGDGDDGNAGDDEEADAEEDEEDDEEPLEARKEDGMPSDVEAGALNWRGGCCNDEMYHFHCLNPSFQYR